MKWSDVVGHAEQKRHLQAVRTPPHALIFGGPSSVGKLAVAHAFAAHLLCRKLRGDGSPDEQIDPELHRLFDRGNHPDLHILAAEEGKREISVEGVRELLSKLRLRPYYNTAAVAIIDNAHRMSTAAANALLMTLEEPPLGTYLLLVTDAPHRLLPTIVSRCQLYTFGELSSEETAQVLSRLFDADTASMLEDVCDGSLAPLELEPFVEKRTLAFRNSDEASAHAKVVAEDLHQIRISLREVRNPVSLASQFAAQETPRYWQVLRAAIRSEMRSCSSEGAHHRWAELLLSTMRAEQSVAERNLSVHNLLPEILFRLAAAQRAVRP